MFPSVLSDFSIQIMTLFLPRFAERDEGEREPPFEKYPWDRVSRVRPFSRLATKTTVGVY